MRTFCLAGDYNFSSYISMMEDTVVKIDPDTINTPPGFAWRYVPEEEYGVEGYKFERVTEEVEVIIRKGFEDTFNSLLTVGTDPSENVTIDGNDYVLNEMFSTPAMDTESMLNFPMNAYIAAGVAWKKIDRGTEKELTAGFDTVGKYAAYIPIMTLDTSFTSETQATDGWEVIGMLDPKAETFEDAINSAEYPIPEPCNMILLRKEFEIWEKDKIHEVSGQNCGGQLSGSTLSFNNEHPMTAFPSYSPADPDTGRPEGYWLGLNIKPLTGVTPGGKINVGSNTTGIFDPSGTTFIENNTDGSVTVWGSLTNEILAVLRSDNADAPKKAEYIFAIPWTEDITQPVKIVIDEENGTPFAEGLELPAANGDHKHTPSFAPYTVPEGADYDRICKICPATEKAVDPSDVLDALAVAVGQDLPTPLTIPEGSNYTIESIEWTKEDGSPTTGKAADDEVYTAKVTLKADTGYFIDMEIVNGWQDVGFRGSPDNLNLDIHYSYTAEFEKKFVTAPKAAVDTTGEALTGLKPGKSYTIKGTDVNDTATADETGRIIIKYAWMGKDITIARVDFDAAQTLSIPKCPVEVSDVAFGKLKEGYTNPEAKKIDIKSTGDTQAVITGVTADKIDNKDVFVISGADYAWTIKPVEGLAAGEYNGLITVTYNTGKEGAKDKSCKVNVTLKVAKKEEQAAPAKPALESKTKSSVTLKAAADSTVSGAKAEYSIDGGKTWQDSTTFTGLTSSTKYKLVARYKETDNYNASPASEVLEVTTSSGGSSSGGSFRPSRPSRPLSSSSPSAPSQPASSAPTTPGGGIGWDKIGADIGKSEAGSDVTVNLNGSSTVPADVLAAAANNDVKLTLKVDDTFTWEVDGANISGSVRSADFTVKSETVPAQAVTMLALMNCDSTKAISVSGVPFAYKPELHANFGKKSAGKFANLYKVNEATGALKFAGVAKIDADGNVEIPVTENGKYVIAVDTETKMMGDFNNSMGINALDAAALLKEIVSVQTTGAYKGDVDGDGKVDALDVAKILKRIVGLE